MAEGKKKVKIMKNELNKFFIVLTIFVIISFCLLNGCLQEASKEKPLIESENSLNKEVPAKDLTNEANQQKEPEEIKEEDIDCTDFDGNKEECLLHQGCKWSSDRNECDSTSLMKDEDEQFEEDEEGFMQELEEIIVPQNPSNEICKKLPLLKSLSYGNRYYCLAIVNHNAEFCRGMDEENEENICLAIVKKDSSHCKKIKDVSAKHVCYYQLAAISKNINFCDDIDYDENERLQCYFNFVSNLYWFDKSEEIKTEYCNKFPAGESDKSTCLAFKERNASLCKNNVNCLTFFEQEAPFCENKRIILKDCVRDRAMTSKDVSICEKLSGKKRDDCIGDFCTHIELDVAICDKITSIKEKQSRYIELAINLANNVRESN